jgi:hypothetical protein
MMKDVVFKKSTAINESSSLTTPTPSFALTYLSYLDLNSGVPSQSPCRMLLNFLSWSLIFTALNLSLEP